MRYAVWPSTTWMLQFLVTNQMNTMPQHLVESTLEDLVFFSRPGT